MITVYCDDSGRSDKDRVAVVAGYISSVSRWERFATSWRQALDAEGVEVMHRSDLETFHGEFREPAWNPARRTKFLQRLHKIIRRSTHRGFGISVIKADFDKVFPPAAQKFWGGPYGWCAQACIGAARAWCESVNHTEPIQWVFEVGTCGAAEVSQMFASLYADPRLRQDFRVALNGHSFQSKSVLPLQSADVLAYEVFKQTENGVLDGHRRRPPRLSLLDLLRPDEVEWYQFWNEERLETWFREWNRRRAQLRGVPA